MADTEERLGTSTTMNAGIEEETQCEWNWSFLWLSFHIHFYLDFAINFDKV